MRPSLSNGDINKKLVHSLNNKKIPSLKQYRYVGKVLTIFEKRIILVCLGLIVASLVGIGVRFYLVNFQPVPIIGGEYTEGLIGAPQYINPLLSQTNDVDSDISRLVFAGLMQYDKDLNIIPDLADSWSMSADSSSYTFRLRDGLTWHDGQPLTASDVVFTIESIQDPDFKSPLFISFRGVAVSAPDDTTVVFNLPDGPFPGFLELMTLGILPQHIWRDIPTINANLTEYNLKPIGSGPWKFDSFLRDTLGNVKSYTLVPFENYHGQKPYLEKLTFKFYPHDFQPGIEALKRNTVEGLSFLPKDLKLELVNKKDVTQYALSLPQYTALFLNQRQQELFKDKKIRQALAVAIDKPYVLTQALQREGELIHGPLLPLSDDQQSTIQHSVERANTLLEEAGWDAISPAQYVDLLITQAQEAQNSQNEDKTDEGSEENTEENATTTVAAIDRTEFEARAKEQLVYRAKDGEILELTITTVNQPESIRTAEIIKELWQKLGIKITINTIEGNRITRDVIKPRDYEILLYGIIVGSDPDPYPFWHSSQIEDPGLNLSLFSNRAADELLEKARTTTSTEQRLAAYTDFQKILTEEVPAIFLHNPTYTYVVTNKIKGITIERIIIPADRFNNLEEWYVKTKRTYQPQTE